MSTTLWFPWALRQGLVTVIIVVAILVVPGTTAVIQRPQNATEGYLALGLAVLALAWQATKAAGQRLVIEEEGVRTRGLLLAWADLDTTYWDTTRYAGRATHQLRARVHGRVVPLCRAAAPSTAAERFSARLGDCGVPVTPPEPRLPVRPGVTQN